MGEAKSLIKKKLKKLILAVESVKRIWVKNKLNRVYKIFRNWQDFEIKYDKGIYRISFNDSLGYLPAWDYCPEFSYDIQKDAWEVIIKDVAFYVKQFPLFELVNELRGYLLLGDSHRNCVIIDAGPAAGISSMYFAKRIGQKGKLMCIEPDERAVVLLKENLELNQLRNIEIIQKGLFNKTSQANFIMTDSIGGSYFTENSMQNQKIDLIDLKTLVKRYCSNKVDFLKIDIEGAEAHILEDIEWIIKNNPKIVVAIASYHKYGNRKTSAIIEEYFQGKNICRTVYPYHETTFIIGKENEKAREQLMKWRNTNFK